MNKTAIEWTDYSWPIVNGCTRVSPGCTSCYAERLAATRLRRQPKYEGLARMHNGDARWTGEVRPWPAALEEPLRLRKPSRIFVADMGDLFHEGVPFQFIAAVFGVMHFAEQHTFQVLTKRPDRMREFMEWIERPDSITLRDADGTNVETMPTAQRCLMAASALAKGDPKGSLFALHLCAHLKAPAGAPIERLWPLPNVWLGVSVEDQERADERIPLLLETRAAGRFLSVEPLLGAVDLSPYIDLVCPVEFETASDTFDPAGYDLNDCAGCGCAKREHKPGGIDWVIVGGESGPAARPCDVAWIRSVVEQCKAAVVPVFVKQWGAHPHDGIRCRAPRMNGCGASRWSRSQMLRDRKGGDPLEWPSDLRVREFPKRARLL